jgi:uncharacterized protein YndB with AHSA1/START domain
MKPITFSCEASFAVPPERIAEQILDLSRWPEFRGYGPLPGIRSAQFEARTPEVVGTRIRVTDMDGSSHVEEIVEWEPDRRIRLRMGEFSAPLSRLATHFDETFEFERTGGHTRVVRRFELHPKGTATRPLLWLISVLLKRAIARHLRQMKEASRVPAGPVRGVGQEVTKLPDSSHATDRHGRRASDGEEG